MPEQFSFSGRHLTRGQLIGGLLTTAALAACGGGANPSTPANGTQCTAGSLDAAELTAIFSDPTFDSLDKQKLAELFDPSAQLEANDAAYFSQAGRQTQVHAVIRSIPATGIVIRAPGRYTFGGDILWTPGADKSAAISIECSGVVLDLAGYKLRASVADSAWQTTGIRIGLAADALITNVTIRNGTIANLTEYGIFAKSVCGLDISNITVTGVCIQNLQTPLLTPSGIYVSKSLDVVIADCSVTESQVTADSCAGIFLYKTAGANVNGCVVDGFKNLDGAVQGFSCIHCMNVTTAGCTAKNLQSFFHGNTKTSGHTVLGFCPIICFNLNYVDCTASGLTGSCDDVHGISVFLDGQVTVTRFHADTIVDGPPPYNTGAKATGVEVYGVDVTVTDCTASNITAYNPQDKQATGFSAWGLTIGFNNCTATNIVATGAGAQGTGFGWAPDPRWIFRLPATGVAYTNCTADSCAVGFDTFYHVNSVWLHPTCTGCVTNVLIQPGAQRTLICDGCSECAPGNALDPSPAPSSPAPNPPAPSPPQYYVTLTNIASGNLVIP